jgi:hypothetical protein
MASHSIKIDLKALMKPYGEKLSAAVMPVIAFDVIDFDGPRRLGVTVVIYHKETKKPLASGTAYKAFADDDQRDNAVRIAAKRACDDLSRQAWGMLESRAIYHEFRKQRREAKETK